MKEHIKKKWVEALRSGKYKQGQNFLKSDDGYCCLGVLCDLHRKTMKKGGYVWENECSLDSYFYFENNEFLPKIVWEWAGLTGDDPKVEGCRLSEHNDDGCSFNEIADMIEEEL